MHRLKALGLCFVAVFAMSAVVAAAAQAAPEYKSESPAPTFLHGESTDNMFTITHSPENLTVSCSKTTVSGEVGATSVKTVSVHPEYTGCELNEIPAKVVVPTACNYRLNQPTALGGTPPSWTITVSILTCPSTAPIKITTTGCTVEVSETGNSALAHIILTNGGSGTTRDIFGNITLTGITAKQSSGCPGGAGTFTTADYTGTITVKGYTSAAHTTQKGIWVE
jgi:hypothetical protein